MSTPTDPSDLSSQLTALQQDYADLTTIHEITLEHSNDIEAALEQKLAEIAELARDLDVRNRLLRKVFGRYMTDEVAAVLIDSPENFALGGERRRVTIMMSDLRGFTPMCERLTPEQTVRTLNVYLGEMAEVIARHGGWINEFIGDAILAVFGAPLVAPRAAAHAVQCALEMQLAMTRVNEQLAAEGLPQVQMGIGLHTGEVVVGNVGSERRAKFGLVGSAVNLTSRIESYTIGGQVLISESTAGDLDEQLHARSTFKVNPKGVRHAVTIYDVAGLGSRMLPTVDEELTPIVEGPLVGMSLIDGKDAGGEVVAAMLLALGDKEALFRFDQPPAVRSNLKLTFDDAGLGEGYGKVVSAEADTFRVHFTSLPPAAARWLSEFKRATTTKLAGARTIS